MPLKSRLLLIAAVLLTQAAGISAQTAAPRPRAAPAPRETAMLRVVCFDNAEGATISINGVTKGPCPFDVEVPAGIVRIHAEKQFDAYTENSRDMEITLGGGVVKRVVVEWTAPHRYTAAGLARQRQREADEEAAALARQAAERDATRKQAGEIAGRVTAAARKLRPNSNPTCPDCPSAIGGTVAAVPDLPSSSDPEIQGWFDRARAELTTFSASAGMSMQPPVAMNPLPCGGLEPTLRHLAGLRNFTDMSADDQEAYRSATANGAALVDMHYQNLRIWPVRMTCLDDVLDGPLDFWMYGLRVENFGNPLQTEPIITHVQANMHKGKANGPISRVNRKRESLSTSMDLSPTANLNIVLPYKRDIFRLTYFYPDDATKAGTYMQVTVTREADVGQPAKPISVIGTFGKDLPGGVSESFGFTGDRLMWRSVAKDTIWQGPRTIYAYDAAGNPLPPKNTCYDKGKVVPTDPCPMP